MKIVKLSICIPTYNRATYLDQTLASIINQIDADWVDDVEICISDNASTDGTEELIANWRTKSLVRLVYARNPENLGADRNYMRVVELATGEYCWFFGSDDLMAGGSLKRMLQEIRAAKDIYLCNRIECDIAMCPQRGRHWLASSELSQVFQLARKAEFRRYLQQAQSIGALFSFLSSIIFKRARWNQYQIDPVFIGTAYSHVYMLLSFIPDGCDLSYIRDPLVLCRGQNDSFESEGIVKRVMLDIEGYTLLMRKCSAANQVAEDFLAVLRRERPVWRTLVFVRLRVSNDTWKKMATIFHSAKYGRVKVALAGISRPLFVFLKKLRKLLA